MLKMIIQNEVFKGANKKESLIDLALPKKDTKELVLFIHGYKGYKDWGAWNNVEAYFLSHQIGFAKLNLSHNGGTVDQPIDFPDLASFGENRYTYELIDIERAIEWIHQKIDLGKYNLTLIGHSRGGGLAVLSGTNKWVKRVITWAAIDDIFSRFPKGEELEKWKQEGVRYVKNGRTKQDMPHYFSFYTDFIENKDLLDIKKAAHQLKTLEKPCMHIHGKNDEAVDYKAALNLARWSGGKNIIIEGTGHTFDTKHPWIEDSLPLKMKEVCDRSKAFVLE
jgi:pimeloyl-ACP methyl ester carboxylesterase